MNLKLCTIIIFNTRIVQLEIYDPHKWTMRKRKILLHEKLKKQQRHKSITTTNISTPHIHMHASLEKLKKELARKKVIMHSKKSGRHGRVYLFIFPKVLQVLH